MVDDKHGEGYYTYRENNESGNHEIWCVDPGIIRVIVEDKGKANLRNGKDNEPATQRWKNVADNDTIIDKFEKILNQI